MKTIRIKLFNHIVELHFRARCKWTSFKHYKRLYYNHLVWGRMSLLYGQPHLEEVHVCSHCLDEIQQISSGDEGWSYCANCHQVEGDTTYITMEEYEAR